MVDAPRRSTSNPLTILVAEDNEALRLAVVSMLVRRGHQVDAVANGREAVDAARARHYDVVFLDMQMPIMDGEEAAAWLRDDPTTRIIGMSGDPENPDEHPSVALDGFLSKPIRLEDLERVLERPRSGEPPRQGPLSPPTGSSNPSPSP